MAKVQAEVLEFPGAERDLKKTRWFFWELADSAVRRVLWVAMVLAALSAFAIWANQAGYVVRGEGDSNYPFYKHGDIRVILPLTPRPGDLVSARVRGEDEGVLKWLREDGGLYSSNFYGATYEPDEVVRIAGRQVACIPMHYLLGRPPKAENLSWSPSGARLAYLAVGKIHIRQGRRTRVIPNGDYSILEWLDDETLLCLGFFGSYHLIGLDGQEKAAKIVTMATSTLDTLERAGETEEANWETRSWYREAVSHRWLDREQTLLWLSYSVPISGGRCRWESKIFDSRTGKFSPSLGGVSDITPSGFPERFIAFRRAGDPDMFVLYNLYNKNHTQELGSDCAFDWSRDGKKLAWAVDGRIRVRVWR